MKTMIGILLIAGFAASARCGDAFDPSSGRGFTPRPKISAFPIRRTELPAGSGKSPKNVVISVGSARF